MYLWTEGEDLEYGLDGEENSECHVEVAECVRVDLIRSILVVMRVELFCTQTCTFTTL